MIPSVHTNPSIAALSAFSPLWNRALPRSSAHAPRPTARTAAPALRAAVRTPAVDSTHAHTAVRMDVRLIRPLRESGHGRMVLTGRMADVCAALDLMVACQEAPLEAA